MIKVNVYLPVIKWDLEVQHRALQENLMIFLMYHQLKPFKIELPRYTFIFLVRFSSISFSSLKLFNVWVGLAHGVLWIQV